MKNNTLIFGGSKGIGAAITNNLKKRGDKVIVFSRNVKNTEHSISIDMENPKAIQNFIQKNKLKKINNIVFSQRYRGNKNSGEIQVMLKATENLIVGLADKMTKDYSSIVIISSVCLEGIVEDQNLQYHMVRGSLDQLVKYMAVTLGKKKIRINSILATRSIKKENEKFYNKRNNKIRKNLEKITPLGRMSDSKDVANAVNFLTDKKSNYITGQNIKLDGGLSLINQEHILYIKR